MQDDIDSMQACDRRMTSRWLAVCRLALVATALPPEWETAASNCVLNTSSSGHEVSQAKIAQNGFRCHISFEFHLAYIEVPKAASTTISSLMRALGGVGAFKGHRLHHVCMELRRNDTSPFYRFSFVRDPLARLISTYNYIDMPHGSKRGAEVAGDARHFASVVAGYAKGDGSNYHWIKQLAFLSVEHPPGFFALVNFDFIGRLENFRADWRRVEQAVAVPSERRAVVPHLRQMSKKPAQEYASLPENSRNVCHLLADDYRCLHAAGLFAPPAFCDTAHDARSPRGPAQHAHAN